MIKRNLIVSIDSPDGFEKDVVSLRTTVADAIVIETVGSKLAVNPDELMQAVKEVKEFLQKRAPIDVASKAAPLSQIIYGDDEASNS